MSRLDDFANRIRYKREHADEVAELNRRFEEIVVITRRATKAFRDTIDRVQKDFQALTDRVKKLEDE